MRSCLWSVRRLSSGSPVAFFSLITLTVGLWAAIISPVFAEVLLAPVSAVGEPYTGSDDGSKTIDGSNSSGWTTTPQGVLTVDLGTVATVTRYELLHWTGNYITAPDKWLLKVSQDGSSWSTVDTRNAVGGWASASTFKSFPVAAPAPGRYLRWEFNGTYGASSALVIRELRVYRAPEPEPSPSPSSTPPPGQTTNPDGSIDVRVNVGVDPIDVRVNVPSSIDLEIPVIQDPSWLPVWEKLFYVLLKLGAVLVVAWFLGRLL